MPADPRHTDELQALRRFHDRQAKRCQLKADEAEQQGKTRWFRTWLSRAGQHRQWLRTLKDLQREDAKQKTPA